MSARKWRRTVLGAEKWDTFADHDSRPVVLAAAHTLTSTLPLLDLVQLLQDSDCEVLFTTTGTSVFEAGVRELLDGLGARTVRWRDARRGRFDLTLAATTDPVLHQLRTPLLIVPHGAGHHKQTADGQVPGLSAARLLQSRLRPRRLLSGRRVIADALAFAHPGQITRLAAECPEAVRYARVTGDGCLAILRANRHRRERYRRALGISDGQRLVLVASTWGQASLIGRHPILPARLLATLPADRYRVALATHANVPARHGQFNLGEQLTPALDSGLLLLDNQPDWRTALIAADCLITDQGSVCSYGAALSVPLLLGGFATEQIVPGTPLAELGRTVPRLDLAEDVSVQIEQVLAEHAPERYRSVAEQIFDQVDQAPELLRAVMYELMGRPVPTGPVRLRMLPDPAPYQREVPAYRVRTEVGVTDGQPLVRLARYPEPAVASLDRRLGRSWWADRPPLHLVAWEERADPYALGRAAIVVGPTTSARRAADWLTGAAKRYPGARLVMATVGPGRVLLRERCGAPLTAWVESETERTEPAWLASVVYALLLAGAVPTVGPVAARLEADSGPLTVWVEQTAQAESASICTVNR